MSAENDIKAGELREFHTKIIGIPLIRRARRVNCGFVGNPHKCPFAARNGGELKCSFNQNPRPIEVSNFVIREDGSMTGWRPSEIECGVGYSTESAQEDLDPLLQLLPNCTNITRKIFQIGNV